MGWGEPFRRARAAAAVAEAAVLRAERDRLIATRDELIDQRDELLDLNAGMRVAERDASECAESARLLLAEVLEAVEGLQHAEACSPRYTAPPAVNDARRRLFLTSASARRRRVALIPAVVHGFNPAEVADRGR